jgi:hypothetical protein
MTTIARPWMLDATPSSGPSNRFASRCSIFEEFRVHRTGERIIVEPKLRPQFVSEGTWRTLDFGAGASAVEVVDYLDPVVRKVDLTRTIAARISRGNS